MSVGYPSPTVSFPANRARPPSGATAETLVLIALVLQVIGGLLVLAGLAWVFGFSILKPFPFALAVVLGATIVAVLVVVFLYLAYTLSYQRIQRGEYQAAQVPTLVIGILSLFLGLIPGIFYLLGYVKLGDAVREQQTPMGPYGLPPSGVMGAPQIACRSCGRVYPLGAYTYCPNCVQKLGT